MRTVPSTTEYSLRQPQVDEGRRSHEEVRISLLQFYSFACAKSALCVRAHRVIVMLILRLSQ
jgi:hypothetical protein